MLASLCYWRNTWIKNSLAASIGNVSIYFWLRIFYDFQYLFLSDNVGYIERKARQTADVVSLRQTVSLFELFFSFPVASSAFVSATSTRICRILRYVLRTVSWNHLQMSRAQCLLTLKSRNSSSFIYINKDSPFVRPERNFLVCIIYFRIFFVQRTLRFYKCDRKSLDEVTTCCNFESFDCICDVRDGFSIYEPKI